MTALAGTQFELRQLSTTDDLLVWPDFIREAVVAVKGTDTSKTTEQVLEAVRRHVGDLEYLFLIQLDGIVPMAFAANFLASDAYGEIQVVTWLVYIRPGGDRQQLDDEIVRWGKIAGAKEMLGANEMFTPAKRKWFSRLGYRLKCEVWSRRI